MFNCFLFIDIIIYRGFLIHRVLIIQATHHNHHMEQNSVSGNISIQIYRWALHPLCSLLEFWLKYSVCRCMCARAHACVCVWERYHSFHFPSSYRCPWGIISPFEQLGDYYSPVWLIEIWTNIYFSKLPNSGRKLRQLTAEALCTARVSFLFSVASFYREYLKNKSQQWFFFQSCMRRGIIFRGRTSLRCMLCTSFCAYFTSFYLFIFPHTRSHRSFHL